MTEFPEPLRSFWYELDATEWSRRTPWGMVFADPRYPLLYDANHAAVLEEMPDLELSEIREGLLPAIRAAGAPHEQVEFWAGDDSPAVDEMRARVAESRDVAMVFDPSGPAVAGADGGVRVVEITEPDSAFLDWYRASRSDFGERPDIGPVVADQLFRRDIEQFVPRGLRFFVGLIDGEIAGQTTLFGFGGIGYVDSVVTRAEFRRRGVATATVLRAVEASVERGDELVHLLAVKDSAPQRLYERLGFRVASEIISFTHPLDR
jgi:ribosomal protein S18 acetylase RimI-like enzyme